MTIYGDLDQLSRAALAMDRARIRSALGPRMSVHDTNEAIVAAMAGQMLADYRDGIAGGRPRVAMIVPVGPVGQYDLIAEECRQAGLSLDRLTLVVMDEYLTDEGQWIAEDDPLSFRGHLRRHLLERLPEGSRPELVVPDPADPGAVGRRIADLGGLDVTYAGVGITGHLAFNEPMIGVSDPEYFAGLPTRVVPLLPETRLINAVTAARGNVARIPRMAVTVGMREILSARTLRIYMNRHWQSAAIRRLAFGPREAAFPASLIQTHPDWHLDVVDHVLDMPEPELA